jgi:hypothetical protein
MALLSAYKTPANFIDLRAAAVGGLFAPLAALQFIFARRYCEIPSLAWPETPS